MRPDDAGGLGDVAGAESVHAEGTIRDRTSQASTAVQAAEWMMTSGWTVPTAASTASRSATSRAAAIGCDDVERRPAAPLAGPATQVGDDLGPDLPGRAGNEHTHRWPDLRDGALPATRSPRKPPRPATVR